MLFHKKNKNETLVNTDSLQTWDKNMKFPDFYM